MAAPTAALAPDSSARSNGNVTLPGSNPAHPPPMPPVPILSSSGAASLSGRVTPHHPQRLLNECYQPAILEPTLWNWADEVTETSENKERRKTVFYMISHFAEGKPQLTLAGTQLSSLPPNMNTFSAVTKLDLFNNKLKSILDDALPPNLTALDVRNNRLSCLPKRLPVTLQNLMLADNRLTTLPDHLFPGLVQLLILDVSNNRITALPPTLPSTLKQVEARNNALTALPSLPKLSLSCHLDVRDNKRLTEETVFEYLRNMWQPGNRNKGPRLSHSFEGRSSGTCSPLLDDLLDDWGEPNW